VLENLNRTTFEPYLNTTFRIRLTDADAIEVTLIEAKALSAEDREHSQRVPFAILFQGPVDPVLAQGIYRIEHAELGFMDIFLVPVGPRSDGMTYEAVFN